MLCKRKSRPFRTRQACRTLPRVASVPPSSKCPLGSGVLTSFGLTRSLNRNAGRRSLRCNCADKSVGRRRERSEEHTSELQSQSNLVCRLLLEKKKTNKLISDDTSRHMLLNMHTSLITLKSLNTNIQTLCVRPNAVIHPLTRATASSLGKSKHI